MIGKLVKGIVIVLILVVLSSPFWIRIVPSKYIPAWIGNTPVDKLLCNYSVNTGGESLKPLVKPGSLNFSRCIEESDLVEGGVVLFSDTSGTHLGIIRYVLPLDPIIYKVSDEISPDMFHDLVKEEIVGVNNDIDTSLTKYKTEQEAESFVLDPNDFLTDFYIGRIPRGSGIEMSTVEKTASFSRQEDKFCTVIFPKKLLVGVDTEIVNTKTGEVANLGTNSVLDTNLVPNIGCSIFSLDGSTGPETLNLEPGTYLYKFMLKHQVLESVQFEVK